jgi:hypothetical protein
MTVLTLSIGEIRIEGIDVDPEAFRQALEAALDTLARQLQARAAGVEATVALSLPDLTVRLPQAAAALTAPSAEQLVGAILAAVTARVEGSP